MNRLEKHIVSSITALAEELIILGLSKRNENKGRIFQKDIKEKGFDYGTPMNLIQLGYIKIDSKTEDKYPFCDYQITEKGEKYMKDIENFLNYQYDHE